MIWLFSIIAILVGLVLVMALVGALLPRGHVATRAATIHKPPDEVWRALTDLDSHPRWRRGLKKVERTSPTAFREHSRHGVIAFEIVSDEPARRRVTRIADDKLPFGGRWIFELAPENGATRLTITEDGIVKNVIFRFMSKFIFGHATTLEQFLADLDAYLMA